VPAASYASLPEELPDPDEPVDPEAAPDDPVDPDEDPDVLVDPDEAPEELVPPDDDPDELVDPEELPEVDVLPDEEELPDPEASAEFGFPWGDVSPQAISARPATSSADIRARDVGRGEGGIGKGLRGPPREQHRGQAAHCPVFLRSAAPFGQFGVPMAHEAATRVRVRLAPARAQVARLKIVEIRAALASDSEPGLGSRARVSEIRVRVCGFRARVNGTRAWVHWSRARVDGIRVRVR